MKIRGILVFFLKKKCHNLYGLVKFRAIESLGGKREFLNVMGVFAKVTKLQGLMKFPLFFFFLIKQDKETSWVW
jgi:hypothetical protein